VTIDGATRAHHHRFDGDPPDVVRASVRTALHTLLDALRPVHPSV
jgi:hypothetical protein